MDTKTQLLDGKALAERIQTKLKQHSSFTTQIGRPPGLAVLMVGDNQPAPHMYGIKNEPAPKWALPLLGAFLSSLPNQN